MDTRHLGYLGAGILVAIVGLTLLSAPPAIWIMTVVFIAAVGVALIAHDGREREDDDAIAPVAPAASGRPTHTEETTSDAKPVSVELVRPADSGAGSTDVWLHRCGGRRVHRYAATQGWVVEQVSTKDPDNPKKRVIGQTLSFASEADAVRAADDLARGITPNSPRSAGQPEPTSLPAAAARA